MAYLKRAHVGSGTYFYIVESNRRGDKVTKKVLEYLGRDPDPKRLAAALRYWKVGHKKRLHRRDKEGKR